MQPRKADIRVWASVGALALAGFELMQPGSYVGSGWRAILIETLTGLIGGAFLGAVVAVIYNLAGRRR